MKKSTIWLLAVIMALTFIGLLYVQIMYMDFLSYLPMERLQVFPFANKPVRLSPLLLHDKRNTIRSLVHIEICRKPVKDNTFTKKAC